MGLDSNALTAMMMIMPLLAPNGALAQSSTAILTQNFDNQRSGWNGTETTLNPANVSGSHFGLLATVALDDQVDGQPLVVPNQNITGGSQPGTYQVVYVATQNNTIYAINSAKGAILLQRSFGQPVPPPVG